MPERNRGHGFFVVADGATIFTTRTILLLLSYSNSVFTFMSDTQKLIAEALDSVEQSFNTDTEQSIRQLENLRQINTSTTLKFIRKEEELKSLARKTEKISTISEYIHVNA